MMGKREWRSDREERERVEGRKRERERVEGRKREREWREGREREITLSPLV